MFIKFNDLPTEIQLMILEIAIDAEYQHYRIVVYDWENPSWCMKVPPPALPQVCRMSRDATLRLYPPRRSHVENRPEYKSYNAAYGHDTTSLSRHDKLTTLPKRPSQQSSLHQTFDAPYASTFTSNLSLPEEFNGFDTSLTVMATRRSTRSSLPAAPDAVSTTPSRAYDTAATEVGHPPDESPASAITDLDEPKMDVDEDSLEHSAALESEQIEEEAGGPSEFGALGLGSDDLEDEEGRFVPVKMHKERDTEEGLEFLVEWEDYPNEEDWTWELEETVSEDVPDLVVSWQLMNGAVVDEPEKILRKRKYRGIDHYLVKWLGYPKVKDRTWEPCDRFGIDAPTLVEAYQLKKRKK